MGTGCNMRRPNDSANLLAFLKVLRAEIGRDKLITAAVSTSGFLGPDGKALRSFADFARELDYINLMTVSENLRIRSLSLSLPGACTFLTPDPSFSFVPPWRSGTDLQYDVSGSWSPTTGPHSPLRKCRSDSSAWTAVKLGTSRGFPANQILLCAKLLSLPLSSQTDFGEPPTDSPESKKSGIPSYAVSFTTKASQLATVSIENDKWRSKAYQGWTGVVPQGAPGNSNGAVADLCGKTCAGYSGQWQYKELVANGVRPHALSLSHFMVRRWADFPSSVRAECSSCPVRAAVA